MTKPYKGPDSYSGEDADLFFGRELEAEQILAKILSSRFTLLHAQSAAGKTSLLNARVIPDLESRGAMVVKVRLNDSPVDSVKSAVIHGLFPSLDAEVFAVRRAVGALFGADADPTIGELLQRYDELPVRDERRRSLIAGLSHRQASGDGVLLDAVYPHFCRLLRSTIEVEQFSEHLRAVGLSAGADVLSTPVGSDTLTSTVISTLSSPDLAPAHSALVTTLSAEVTLKTLFERLFTRYARFRTNCTLAIILDQFEELFTRFVDFGQGAPSSGVPAPDWRLRTEFFEQFEQVYTARIDLPALPSGATDGPMPIRWVISMRDEYVAQLDALRRFIWDIDACSFHLRLLDREEARKAIEKPADLFDYSYQSECYDSILEQLTKEDRFIEPSHLQIICETLWNEYGKALAGTTPPRTTDKPQVPLEAFLALGGAKGILRGFFRQVLAELDDAGRLEALEMLEPLVTTTGTRNIVEREVLVNAPFRRVERRRAILAQFVNKTIVRVEPRLKGYFVEITHEFLIGPILEAIVDELIGNPSHNHFRWAVKSLERSLRLDTDVEWSSLTLDEFNILHASRESVAWTAAAQQLMLLSGIRLGASPEVMRVWVDALAGEPGTWDLDECFSELEAAKRMRRQMSLGATLALNRNRSSLALNPGQTHTILHSMLVWAVEPEREDIRYWAQRAYADDSK